MLFFLIAAAITIPQTGRVVLPRGVVSVTEEIRIPDGAHDLVIEGHPRGTVLRRSPGYLGRSLVYCGKSKNVRLERFSIDGVRDTIPDRAGLPPSNVAFAAFYKNNGIVAEAAEGLTVSRLTLRRIWGFPILVNGGNKISIQHVEVRDSGSRNEKNRNNTTGGILFEEGTADFEVVDSKFLYVLGNGVWTHSNYGSPRSARGLMARNEFHEIGRDALQAGHATEIRVEDNIGTRIGYPLEAVDIENGATPVGVDTSGNVDKSIYTRNRFEELNGKCVDLDGFHDGQVTFNTCINRGKPADYPSGHFGIVVNNYNPDMKSEHIIIADNTIDGSKFGGIFLIGSDHTVERNHLLNLNLAHCNEDAAKFGCVAIQGEPDVLQAGIYLGRIAAEWAQKRADASRGNVIRENEVSGFKMKDRCVMAAPGVKLSDNTVENNHCEDKNR